MKYWHSFQAHCAWKHVHPCRELYEWTLGWVSLVGMIYMAWLVFTAFMALPSTPDYEHTNVCVQVSTHVVCGHPTQ